MLLFTSLINVTGVYLYPAYASYKALKGRTGVLNGALDANAELERWLMYWALVGAWTAVEGCVGWILTWIPFYTLTKTFFFLYLSLPNTRGAPYLYHSVLVPMFEEHEPQIDHILANLRTSASGGVLSGLGWLWEAARKALGLTEQQAQGLSQVAGAQLGQQFNSGGAVPASNVQQPPTLADPVSGAAQQAFGLVSGLAGKYMPAALATVSAAAQSVQQRATSTSSARGFDVPATPPAPSATAGSRAFSVGDESVSASSTATLTPGDARARVQTSRNSSDGSLSGSGASGSNLAGSGFSEIRREEAEGAERPEARRTSSSWMKWGNKAE